MLQCIFDKIHTSTTKSILLAKETCNFSHYLIFPLQSTFIKVELSPNCLTSAHVLKQRDNRCQSSMIRC